MKLDNDSYITSLYFSEFGYGWPEEVYEYKSKNDKGKIIYKFYSGKESPVINVRDINKFSKQVFVKETRVLYANTRWVFRIFIVFTVAFVAYSLIVKPGGESTPFAYVGESLNSLLFKFEWPKGEFFGIKNFPVDWPVIVNRPSPKFNLPAIVSYVMLIVWIFTFFGLFTSTLKFIARVHRGRVKAREVFTKSLDDVSFIEE